MPALSHNIDHDIPFNFYQPCPCGNISILNPLACFFHTRSRQEQASKNIWLGLLITLFLYLGWALVC